MLVKKYSLAFLLFPLLLTVSVAAQTTSTITGLIQDQTGAVIPGVEVSAKHLETGLVRKTVSDNNGLFTLPEMRVGDYEVRAE